MRYNMPSPCSGRHLDWWKIHPLAIPDSFANFKEAQCIRGSSGGNSYQFKMAALAGEMSIDQTFSLEGISAPVVTPSLEPLSYSLNWGWYNKIFCEVFLAALSIAPTSYRVMKIGGLRMTQRSNGQKPGYAIHLHRSPETARKITRFRTKDD